MRVSRTSDTVEDGEADFEENLPALEQKQVPDLMDYGEGQLIGEESHDPLDAVEVRANVILLLRHNQRNDVHTNTERKPASPRDRPTPSCPGDSVRETAAQNVLLRSQAHWKEQREEERTLIHRRPPTEGSWHGGTTGRLWHHQTSAATMLRTKKGREGEVRNEASFSRKQERGREEDTKAAQTKKKFLLRRSRRH